MLIWYKHSKFRHLFIFIPFWYLWSLQIEDKISCRFRVIIYLNFPHYISLSLTASEPVCTGWRRRYSVGARPLPVKVAPIQRSVTARFHLQSRRDSDCQMSELWTLNFQIEILTSPAKLSWGKCHTTSMINQITLINALAPDLTNEMVYNVLMD